MVRFEHEFIAKKGQKIGVVLKAHLENEVFPKVYYLGLFSDQQEALDFIEKIEALVLLDIQDPPEFPKNRAEIAIDARYSGTKRAN